MSIEHIKDELFKDGRIFQKVGSVALTLSNNDIIYPHFTEMDSIQADTGKEIWKLLNTTILKRLKAKMKGVVRVDENSFTPHLSFKIRAADTSVSLPFTLDMDDGQVITGVVKNKRKSKQYNPNKPVEVTHWYLNNKDITKFIYLDGDRDIEEATLTTRLKQIIDTSHLRFIKKNPTYSRIEALEAEINEMVIDTTINDEPKKEIYTLNLPSGTEKYIPIIREEFNKDEKLKDVTYSFVIDGVTMDSIDKKSITIKGGDKTIQTHMKKIIHFVTIGADKTEGKDVRMPSVGLIRNAEFIKEKTGLDYNINHEQAATFLTAKEELDYNVDASRKRIIEKINEELVKDKASTGSEPKEYSAEEELKPEVPLENNAPTEKSPEIVSKEPRKHKYPQPKEPYIKSAFSSVSTIIDIDNGTTKGYDRSLFVSSISDKLKTQHKNGNYEIVNNTLDWIEAMNQVLSKDIITKRSSVWKLRTEEVPTLKEEPKSFTTQLKEFQTLTINDLDRATELMEEVVTAMETDTSDELKEVYETMNKHLDKMVG